MADLSVQNKQKKAAAEAAMEFVKRDDIIGVGTGSTVSYFIDALGRMQTPIRGAVSSSEDTTQKLQKIGIEVLDLNQVSRLSVYVDGADEITEHGAMIKGGGAALTREKIIASVADKFICISDGSKLVPVLGHFPLPVEVIPMARSAVARALHLLGGQPNYRMGVTTDNGNIILDWSGLRITNPKELERTVNQITGVVTVGLFACRGADVLLLGTDQGVRKIVFTSGAA